jgi:hypothetical protein
MRRFWKVARFLLPEAPRVTPEPAIGGEPGSPAVGYPELRSGYTLHRRLHPLRLASCEKRIRCMNASLLPSSFAGNLACVAALLLAGNTLAQCNGSWAPQATLAAPSGVFDVLELPSGGIVLGGQFVIPGSNLQVGIATLDPASGTWDLMGGGCDVGVQSIARLPNGDLVAGGNFQTAGGQPIRGLSRWDGSAWHAYGTGISGGSATGPRVHAVRAMANGDLAVAGDFTAIDGVVAPGVATFDGQVWTAVLAPWPVTYSLSESGGGLLLGGRGLARWDGQAITTLCVLNGWVNAIEVRPNQDVVIGGVFARVGTLLCNDLARWDGVAWHRIGYGAEWEVTALATLPGGDLVVGGGFNYMFQGSGAQVPANRLARWDGQSWQAFGAGADNYVSVIRRLASGSYLFGGSFTTIGGVFSPGLAGVSAGCPAAAQTSGSGCSGSAGPVQLESVQLPWLGAIARSRATGLPSAVGLALVVHGLAAVNQPLAGLVPGTPVGCNLLVSPDAVSFALPAAGLVDVALSIPNNPTLIGQSVRQQVLPLEPMANGSALLASNSLVLAIGRF